MQRSTVSKGHLGLICSNRPKCTARGNLSIVGEALTVKKVKSGYELEGDAKQLKNTDNYGEHLYHNHTEKCRGKLLLFSPNDYFSAVVGDECNTTRHADECYTDDSTADQREFRLTMKRRSLNNSLPASKIVDVVL